MFNAEGIKLVVSPADHDEGNVCIFIYTVLKPAPTAEIVDCGSVHERSPGTYIVLCFVAVCISLYVQEALLNVHSFNHLFCTVT